MAAPHEVVQGELRAVDYDNVDGVAPAAAINSNVVDMARWMRLNLRGRESSRAASVFSVGNRPRNAANPQYPLGSIGLGRREPQAPQVQRVWAGMVHLRLQRAARSSVTPADLPGMISLQTLLPEEGLGVIVLTNYRTQRAPTSAITYRILDAYLGEPERDWNAIYRRVPAAGRRAGRAQREEQAAGVPRSTGTRTVAGSRGLRRHLHGGGIRRSRR